MTKLHKNDEVVLYGLYRDAPKKFKRINNESLTTNRN